MFRLEKVRCRGCHGGWVEELVVITGGSRGRPFAGVGVAGGVTADGGGTIRPGK